MMTTKKLPTATAALVGVVMFSPGIAAGDSVTLPFSGDGTTINGRYSSGDGGGGYQAPDRVVRFETARKNHHECGRRP